MSMQLPLKRAMVVAQTVVANGALQPALTLRGEISEPDEAVAAAVCDGDRPAGAARAARAARREALMPTCLHRLADGIIAGWQAGEPVVARGVGHRRCTDRAGELNAPA